MILRRLATFLFCSPLIMIGLVTLYLNAGMYRMSGRNGSSTNTDLVSQLRGMKKHFDRRADRSMQKVFPEGYMFFNALYGLSWCNFLESAANDPSIIEEGRVELKRVYERIFSEEALVPFEKDLSLSYGAFYQGWSTYFLGRKLLVEGPDTRDRMEERLFQTRCDSIADELSRVVFPLSYYQASWPADVVLCVAALSVHDRIYEPRYRGIIGDWLQRLKIHLDGRGLIPHSANAENGKSSESARGSSIALMLIFLKEIDPDFGAKQFGIFKQHFPDEMFGLTGVREYPKGEEGDEDIDSGPVILGMGGAATIVGAGALRLYDDHELASGIRAMVESFCFPFCFDDEKTYFFSSLPIADAFITWIDSFPSTPQGPVVIYWEFHLYSVLFLMIPLTFLWLILRREKPSSKRSLHIPW
jgi:hypothetical protein